MKRIIPAAASALLLLSSLAGCGSYSDGGYNTSSAPAAYYDYDASYELYADEPMYAEDYYLSEPTMLAGSSVSAPVNTDPNRKIIYTVSLELETRDFDSASAEVYNICTELGGYVESSYVSGSSLSDSDIYTYRNASYTLRIPVQNLETAVGRFESGFNVVSGHRYSDDITASYYDVDARLKSLTEEEQRLLDMLDGADELQYMIQLEDKLAEVRYQIEQYYSQLQRMDSSVNYSTVNISLSEVHNYSIVKSTISFADRIKSAFVDSWAGFVSGLQDFAVGFVLAIPTLIVWAIIIVIVVILVRLIIKRHRARKLRTAQAAVQPPLQGYTPYVPESEAPQPSDNSQE